MILWVGMSTLVSLSFLGRWGLAVISAAVHAAAAYGDLGDQIHPLVGQLLMVLGLGVALGGAVGGAFAGTFAVIGAIVTAVERLVV